MAKLDVNVNQLNSDIQGIKAAIIEANVEVPDGTPTSEYGGLVSSVYDTGIKAEYDKFWDDFQRNGTLNYFSNLFSGGGWTLDTFRPKYDIILPSNASAYMMFKGSRINGDLVEILKDLGITLDLSKCGNFQYAFNDTHFTRIGVMDFRNSNYLNNTFQSNTYLETIDEIILKDAGTQDVSSTFNMCTVLKNIKFSGVIGSNINFQWSPLSVESMKNIISCLKNFAGTDKEFVYKVTFSEACLTALEAEGNTSPNNNSWLEYIEDLGWLRG